MNLGLAESSAAQDQHILDTLAEGVYGLDAKYCITFVNRAVQNLLGWSAAEMIGKDALALLHRVKPKGSPFPPGEYPLSWVEQGGSIFNLEDQLSCKDGTILPVEFSMNPLPDSQSGTAMVVVFRDISERKENHRSLAQAFHDMAEINNSLDKARNQLQQSEKMVAIGQLAAGMAHEINNPIGFIQSNLGTLEKYIHALLSLIEQYDEIEANGSVTADCLAKINGLKKVIDFDFMHEDLTDLLDESRKGIERVRKIVQGLREFSQEGAADEWTWLDIPQSLENVLSVIHNEMAGKCSLLRDYGKTPEVYCLPSQINYVFMSILANAAQAIETHGEITIRTGQADDMVWVEIVDTGSGIAPEVLPRIFEPFFTTKPVGKGSGMGLATAYGIVKAHGGRIDVSSTLGKGSSVVVRLPVKTTSAT